MQEADNSKIRDLLWLNLQESEDDVRGEALMGLAFRKDKRIIPVLLELLDDDCRIFELNAAESIASPLLLERLNTIEKSVAGDDSIDSYWYRCLVDAIAKCSHTHIQEQPSLLGT
ncbi:lyase containing HEAT-repeat domain protein [Collimonas pratensis]|uniref:Lyase containing HEAT-repeat domain protein n=2 Tax=Collimonas pratensis TaxID=279113 RepID=A0A127Q6B5_9BURK|nr:lyase containing HEAT-repeat domain protein [Collimonas pratensis]